MIDFKGWKKVAEDKSTTTLKHEKGHTMTIAHKKLPKIQQEHLKRLSMEPIKLADGTDKGTVSDQQPTTNVVVNPAPSAQSAEPAPVSVPQVPQTPNVLLPNGSLNAPAAAQTAQTGLNLNQQVAAEKAKADAVYQKQYLNEQQRLAAIDSKNIQDMKMHTDDFSNYIKGNPINPNAYLENMGAGHKMTTALGLLLSGAGSGLSGQPNMAMDYLNRQIDRNIDAQKARAEQAKTVWGAYNSLYQNQNVASNLAKVSMNNMLTHQADLTAAQLGTPLAAAAAMNLKAQKAAENNKLYLDSAGVLRNFPNSIKGTNQETTAPSVQTPKTEAPPEPQASNAPPSTSDIVHGRFGKSAQANIPNEGKIEPDEYADSPILNKDAQDTLDELRYTPKARDELGPIMSQYTAAQQADTILSQLHDVHQRLFKDAQSGGTSGYIQRHNPVGHVPVIGESLRAATDNPTNRDYETNRTRIVSDIVNALKGSNISGEEVERIVNANSPEKDDTPEAVARKERNIRLFIKNNVQKSLLKDWKLSK